MAHSKEENELGESIPKKVVIRFLSQRMLNNYLIQQNNIQPGSKMDERLE